MTTKNINIHDMKTHLNEILSILLEGNIVILSENDKPLAKIVPFKHPEQKRIAGLNSGEVWVSDDFDDELPDDFWAGSI